MKWLIPIILLFSMPASASFEYDVRNYEDNGEAGNKNSGDAYIDNAFELAPYLTTGNSIFVGAHIRLTSEGSTGAAGASWPIATVSNTLDMSGDTDETDRYIRLEVCGPTSSQCRTDGGGSGSGVYRINLVMKSRGNESDASNSVLGMSVGDVIPYDGSKWYAAGAWIQFDASTSNVTVYSQEHGGTLYSYNDPIASKPDYATDNDEMAIYSLASHTFEGIGGGTPRGAHSLDGDIAAPIWVINPTEAEVLAYLEKGNPSMIWADDRIAMFPNQKTLVESQTGGTWILDTAANETSSLDGTLNLSTSPSRCSRVEVVRDTSYPIGRCMYNINNTCSNDSQCPGTNDGCILGVDRNNTTNTCTDPHELGGNCISDISFEFDQSYECGRYANDEWWVVADGDGVEIVRIEPDAEDGIAGDPVTDGCQPGDTTPCIHGWEVNEKVLRQSLDSRAIWNFTRASPTLPHTVDLGSEDTATVMKIISAKLPSGLTGTCPKYTCTLHNGTVTVEASTPATGDFRPPIGGPLKPSTRYNISDIDFDRLPRLESAKVEPFNGTYGFLDPNKISRMFATPMNGSNARNSNSTRLPSLYYQKFDIGETPTGYHMNLSGRVGASLAALLLDNMDYVSNVEHQTALYRALNYSLDQSWIAKLLAADGAEVIRSKYKLVPIAFAAALFNDPTLYAHEFVHGSEQDTIYRSPKDGEAKWGYATSEDNYWSAVTFTGGGSNVRGSSKWGGDPYGYVDQDWYQKAGPIHQYQYGQSSKAWQPFATVIAALQTADAANLLPFQEYMKRWSERGYHNSPDPCAQPPQSVMDAQCDVRLETCAGYGTTWGPDPTARGGAGNSPTCHLDRSCECIGHGGDPYVDGRLNAQHGLDANTGGQSSAAGRYGAPIWNALADEIYAGTAQGLPGAAPPVDPPVDPPPTTAPASRGIGGSGMNLSWIDKLKLILETSLVGTETYE